MSPRREPIFSPPLDNATGVHLTFGQLWTIVVTICVCAFTAAAGWIGVQYQLAAIRRELVSTYSLSDAERVWNEVAKMNPGFVKPDVYALYKSSH